MSRGEELAARRAMFRAKKKKALPPLVRGWAGQRVPGQKIPNPDHIAECKYKHSGIRLCACYLSFLLSEEVFRHKLLLCIL